MIHPWERASFEHFVERQSKKIEEQLAQEAS